MISVTSSIWNPTLPEDGMVRCPRKGQQAIAVGRCASMRGEGCGACPGLSLVPPKREGGTGLKLKYVPQFPYTEKCMRLGHRPSETGNACYTCAGDSRPTTVPKPCHYSKSGNKLNHCPCLLTPQLFRKDGCRWLSKRQMGFSVIRCCTFPRTVQGKDNSTDTQQQASTWECQPGKGEG